MRRTFPSLVALAVLGLLPAAAGAKEVARAAVCGADGCHEVAGDGGAGHEDSRFQLMAWGPDHRLPKTVGSYYVLRVFMRIDDAGGTSQVVTRWFPDDRLLAAADPNNPHALWMRPDDTVV